MQIGSTSIGNGESDKLAGDIKVIRIYLVNIEIFNDGVEARVEVVQ